MVIWSNFLNSKIKVKSSTSLLLKNTSNEIQIQYWHKTLYSLDWQFWKNVQFNVEKWDPSYIVAVSKNGHYLFGKQQSKWYKMQSTRD